MADLRVPVDPILDAFGVPATVTRPAPDGTPITTTAVWIDPSMLDVPASEDFQRREPRRLLALPVGAVPTVPRGTIVTAPETLGATSQDWRVDVLVASDLDFHRVLVLPEPIIGS